MERSDKSTWIGVAENTPLGDVWIAGSASGLLAVEIQAKAGEFAQGIAQRIGVPPRQESARTSESIYQINQYLNGNRTSFDLAIDWRGMSPVQREVLEVVTSIPYGGITTYGEIARRIGRPRAARAVGRANATNPLPLVVPCHRVIGQDGSLRGYGAPGGLAVKAWLLELEKGESRWNAWPKALPEQSITI